MAASPMKTGAPEVRIAFATSLSSSTSVVVR
jgi:hypothetical protein